MLFAKLELNYTHNYNRASFSGEYLLFIIAFLKKKTYPVSTNSSLIHLLIVDTQAHEVNELLQLLEDTSPKASWQGQSAGGSGQVGSPFPLIQGTDLAAFFWMSSISC